MKTETFYKILLMVIIALIIIGFLIFMPSCIKEEVRNWKCWKLNLIYRAKCGPDSMTFIFRPINKTDKEIIKIQHDSTYTGWVKKEDLQFLYQDIDVVLPDSLLVESKCNCDPYKCN